MTIELQAGPVEPTGSDDAGQSAVERETASKRLAAVMSPEALDTLPADAQVIGIAVDGPDGLIQQMIKAVRERALDVEIADQLGYDKDDTAGAGSGNSPNGFTSKTVITTAGQARIDVPRAP